MRDNLKETMACLETYTECKERLESKEKFLNTLKENRQKRERDVGITGMQYDIMPAKTNKVSSKVEAIAVRNIQMEWDIEEEIESLRYYLNRIDIKIEELKGDWKEVIRLKYIEGSTWEYVARKTGQSESTCRRRAKEGLNVLTEKLIGEKSYIDLPLFKYFYIDNEKKA